MANVNIFPVLCTVVLTVALTAPAAASSPDEEKMPSPRAPKASSAEAAEASVVADGGMRFVFDPETGEMVAEQPLQMTNALSVPLANALNRSTEGLRVFELTNGGRGVHLDGRFQHALVVRMKADGSFETVCVNHSHEAEAILKRGSTPADRQLLDK